jgi:outer membrane protein assembly factor BamB
VSGGHVYIGSEKAQVYALNTSDGYRMADESRR